jgi:hypothetical protein
MHIILFLLCITIAVSQQAEHKAAEIQQCLAFTITYVLIIVLYSLYTDRVLRV